MDVLATVDFIPLEEDEEKEVPSLQPIPNLLADVSEKKRRGTGSSDGEPQVKIIKTADVDKLKKFMDDSISASENVIDMNFEASKAFQADQNRLKYVATQLKGIAEGMSY